MHVINVFHIYIMIIYTNIYIFINIMHINSLFAYNINVLSFIFLLYNYVYLCTTTNCVVRFMMLTKVQESSLEIDSWLSSTLSSRVRWKTVKAALIFVGTLRYSGGNKVVPTHNILINYRFRLFWGNFAHLLELICGRHGVKAHFQSF